MWHMYKRDGSKVSIPEDPFVFWGTLCEHVLLSEPASTNVLWCFSKNQDEKDVCFAATILDSEVWNASCLTGQWKVHLQQEGDSSKCRLTFLKNLAKENFPVNPRPLWLEQYIQGCNQK
jgi:hypothetical protein